MGTKRMTITKNRSKFLFRFGIVLFVAALIVPNLYQNRYVSAGQSSKALVVDVVRLPNLSAKGAKNAARNTVRFAILSRDDFDALKVDPSTITFADAAVAMDGSGKYNVMSEDVDGNGLNDLVVTFARQDLQVGGEPTKADFRARTFDGVSIESHACVQASGEPCGGELILPSATSNTALMKKKTLKPGGGGTPHLIQAVIFSENFDGVTAPALPAGFTTSFVNGAGCSAGSNWVTTTTNPFSAPNAAFHNDPNCITDNFLVSPSIMISTTTAQLSFKNAFSLESGFDGTVLEVSTDGGATWADITSAGIGGSFATGGYNAVISVNFFSPIGGRQAWSGLSGGTAGTPSYIDTVVNLGANLANKTVNFRWRTATDSSVAGTGQFVDNISIDECSITCPANITVGNDPNQCGAVVNYPAPTTSGPCDTVTCSPAAGSFFPVGTTTVTCTSTAGPSCSFTVTVNDVQPPTITCPANVTAVAAQTCPLSTTTAVTFPAPTASDNCPGVTVACVPPSGSIFPAGTTTVTCTATDTSGNTASCSFTVSVFSACLQDDSNPTNVVLFNLSGEYRFCCNGTIFTGTGIATVRGCIVSIQHNPPDRRVLLTFDGAVHRGTASLQSPPGTIKCTITDRNTLNNTCTCQ
jgi:HYR domain